MTVIAWDGKTLAADKRGCWGALRKVVTKIFKIQDSCGFPMLIGVSGNACEGYDMVDWLKQGADPSAFPVNQRDEKLWCSTIVIKQNIETDEPEVWLYERSPIPCLIESPIEAIGSGRDFALAAMHLGKTAGEAVEVACYFDPNCGDGITYLRF